MWMGRSIRVPRKGCTSLRPRSAAALGTQTLAPTPPRRTDALRSFSARTLAVAKRHDWLSTLEDADVANLRARCSKIIEGADAKPYNRDWMNKWEGQARIVAQPASTEEVSAVLAYCNEKRLAVTTQGGKTGLVGGSVPVHDEVILSTTRLNTIEGLDADTGVVTCGAGVVLETLDDYLREYGFVAPLDLGAAGTCTIGGNLATNAGGVRFVRYGSLRGACVGLEFVKADGTVVDCARTSLRKDNTGYALPQLLIGSEGTLGVITKCCIACPALAPFVNVAWLACDDFDAVRRCVEINQCVGCTRQFFTKSFRSSSGEESASPRHRAGVASMAWRTTRRFSTTAP